MITRIERVIWNYDSLEIRRDSPLVFDLKWDSSDEYISFNKEGLRKLKILITQVLADESE